VQRRAVLTGGEFGPLDVVAIGLVDRHHIGELEDTLLDALQVVTCAAEHQHQEAVDHPGHHRLGLTDTHRLHQDHVEPGRLADQDRLPGRTRHPAQRRTRR
jgi:hypothetical protein